MNVHNPAGPRRRARRALLAAAALPAALAAVALPAAADAATVELINSGGNGVVAFNGDSGESNNVRVRLTADGILIEDSARIRSRDSECRIDAVGDAICPATAGDIIVLTGDGNDTIQYKAPHRGFVSGGDGADVIFGGLRQAGFGRSVEPVTYRGRDSSLETGVDTVTYLFADRGVRVDLADSSPSDPITGNDGRTGIDREHILNDIQVIEGSKLDDTLFGSDRNDVLRGGTGNDVIAGRGGDDFIDEGSAPNGADTISGGDGARDRITYEARTTAVNVSLDGVRNDGATGEQDNVSGTVEHVVGTNLRDVLTGNDLPNTIDGLGGNDTINGLGGNDTLTAGSGNNGILAGTGNDVISARNGAIDNIDCGAGTDTADRDTNENQVAGCERGQVGVLRLTPQAMQAKAGETARLRLSWRHPQGWRKLRRIELRLTSDDLPVGELTVRPRAGRIAAGGAVELLPKRTRLTRKGKTVSARLAVRLDDSLAGQTLKAEVEATDRRGQRQLERNAGTVRVGA